MDNTVSPTGSFAPANDVLGTLAGRIIQQSCPCGPSRWRYPAGAACGAPWRRHTRGDGYRACGHYRQRIHSDLFYSPRVGSADCGNRTNKLAGASVGKCPGCDRAVAGVYLLQRIGLVRLFDVITARCARIPKWRSLIGKGGEVDQTLRKVYGRSQAVAACCLVTMMSFVVGSGEVWIGLHALGIPAGFDKALILESVGQGVQTALCFIPGALGVREGGYLVVGGLLGISGEAALALALIRRVREITLGVPGLIAWQLIEGRRLLESRLTQPVQKFADTDPTELKSLSR